MAEIRYRRTGQPNFSGVQAGMASGANTINNGAALLNKALQGAANNRQQRYNAQRDANTQEVLNAISGASTLDALQAGRDAGQFDTTRFNGIVDQAKVDSALRNQDNVIRREMTEAANFEEAQRQRADAPLLAQFGSAMQGVQSEDQVASLIAEARQAGLSDQGIASLTNTGKAAYRDNYRFGNEVADRNEQERSRELLDTNAAFLNELSNSVGNLNATNVMDLTEQHIANNSLRANEAQQLRQDANAVYRNATELNADNQAKVAALAAKAEQTMARAERDNPTVTWVSEYAPGTDYTSKFWSELKNRFPEGSLLHDDDGDAWFGANLAGGTGAQSQANKIIDDVTAEYAKALNNADLQMPGVVLMRALETTESEGSGITHNARMNMDDFSKKLRKAMDEWLRNNRNVGALDNLRDQLAGEVSATAQSLQQQQRDSLKGR